MPILELTERTVKYIPAQVFTNKSNSVVRYYVINPETNKLHRKEIRLNRVKSPRLQKQWGLQVATEINVKLIGGWNPFFEKIARHAHQSPEYAVEKFLEDKKRDIRPATMTSYVCMSNKLVCWWNIHKKNNRYISAFTADDARSFMDNAYLDHGVSAATYNNQLKFFRTFFAWLIDRKYMTSNPFDGIKVKRKDKKRRITIPLDVRERIREHFNGDYMYYVCLLIYRCFMRPKEISMLQLKHIDFEREIIEIPCEISKNHNARYVAIPDELISWISTYRSKNKELYIFGRGGKPAIKGCTTKMFNSRWDKLRTSLNLPMEYQLYSLKDTGITEMLEAGVPAKLVQELADHHSLEMTQKYVHKSNVKEILKYDVLRF